jgi:predicted metal-dependent phosphoesterase TrpH
LTRSGHRRLGLLVATLAALGTAAVASRSPLASPSVQPGQVAWLKGNTHTHTLNSDGDSTPDEVVRWYREHGYNFLVLSDHNYLTSVDGLNAVHGAAGQFLVIRGEEVSDRFDGKAIHLNGLNLNGLVSPQGGTTVTEVVQRNVDAIRAKAGVPHVNHPNFQWAITADDLVKVRNDRLFEIFNGHPMVNNLGGGGAPGLEEMWDRILSSGKLLYGIAVDDAHHFKDPWSPMAARPGRGWVMVRAATLTAGAIVAALERGEFYATTGVELDDYSADATGVRLSIRTDAWAKYRVQFVGRGGRLLAETTGSPAAYSFKGDEQYVRAKVVESNGRVAWTQPVLVGAGVGGMGRSR